MTTEVDPFGVLLATLKADAAVIAIATAARVSSEYTTPPCVVLVDVDDTLAVFGPGSTRLGLQRWIGVARCYGADNPTGAITARQLAGAVRAALHGRKHVAGTSSRWLLDVRAPEMAGMTRDPGTRHPHYDVSIQAVASREAVA